MTSASTLIRRAAKAKNPTVAKRLRSQAARMRREQRGDAKPIPKKVRQGHFKAVRERLPGIEGLVAQNPELLGMNRGLAKQWKVVDSPMAPIGGDLPGRGEIVGAQAGEQGKHPVHALTDGRIAEVLKAAKRKDDLTLGVILREIAMRGITAGRREKEEYVSKALISIRREHRVALVKSFLAQVQAMERTGPGLPPTILLSSLTITAVVDALHDAGWSVNGRFDKAERAD